MEETQLTELLPELNAGIFQAQLEEAIKEVVTGVVATDKQGGFTLSFKLKPIKGSAQLRMQHTLKYTRPTTNGSQVTDETTDTVLFANPRGQLSVEPFNQLKFPFSKKENEQ